MARRYYGPPSDGSVIPHELEDALAADLADASTPTGSAVAGKFALKGEVGTGAGVDTLRQLASAPAHPEVNKAQVVGWGSSTMEGLNGAISAQVSRLGATYTNGAKGGERSEHILARMGARPARLVFPGNEIPASGAVTVTSPNLPASANLRSYAGTAWGVAGTLSSTSTTLTWTRTTAGTAFAIPADPVEFIPTLGVQHRNSFALLNVGKNDIAGFMSDAEGIISAQRAAMAYFSGSGARFLVLGHFVNTNWSVGDGAYRTVLALNDAAKRDAGDYYFDLQGYITGAWGDIWADSGVTPTQADLDQQAAGVKPSSLSADDAHLNTAALWAVAPKIAQKLVDLGVYTETPAPTVADTFTRPDADTPGTTEQGDKTYKLEGLGTTGKAIIDSGTFGFTGVSPGRSMATVEGGSSDGVLSYRVAVDPASSWNYFRVLDYNGYLMVRPFEGNWALWECVGGTRTQIGSSTVPAAAGDLVEITMSGENITVRINGAVAMEVVEASHVSATKFGFGVWGSNAPRWDDLRFDPEFAPQFTPAPAKATGPLYLPSPDGSLWRITISDDGTVTGVPA